MKESEGGGANPNHPKVPQSGGHPPQSCKYPAPGSRDPAAPPAGRMRARGGGQLVVQRGRASALGSRRHRGPAARLREGESGAGLASVCAGVTRCPLPLRGPPAARSPRPHRRDPTRECEPRVLGAARGAWGGAGVLVTLSRTLTLWSLLPATCCAPSPCRACLNSVLGQRGSGARTSHNPSSLGGSRYSKFKDWHPSPGHSPGFSFCSRETVADN